MSLVSSSPTVRPATRRAVFLAVGLGCLLIAGHVLSSIDVAPRRVTADPGADPRAAQCSRNPYISFTPVAESGPGPRSRFVQAEVCLQGDTLQITNTGTDAWRDVRVEVGLLSESHPPVCRLARIVPHETCQLPLVLWHTSPYAAYFCSTPLRVRWHCRTAGGRGAWLGCVVK